MIFHTIDPTAAAATPAFSRRQFVTLSVGGAVGLAFMPLASLTGHAQQAPALPPGQKPTEQPGAFVTIAKDGTTTILCNRMDMGQGIETGLAMICAEELDADWSRVRTGFGDQRGNYVDPFMGMHLTGGSNSIKNSYGQYRELGARTRAMLLGGGRAQWNVPVASLSAANGVVSGGGRSAGYGELFEAAMRQPIPEKVALKDPKNFKLIGQPTGLKVSRAKSSGAQTYGIDIRLPGMLTAVIAHPPTFGAKVKSFDGAAALKIKGVRAVLPVALDRGAQGVAIVATGYWPAKQGRDALKIDWDTSGVDKPDTDRLLTQYRELARSGGKPAPGAQFNADVSAMAQAPNKLSAEFVFPYLNHAQLEPLACTVDLKPDRCDLHYASQMPGVDAGAVARAPACRPTRCRSTCRWPVAASAGAPCPRPSTCWRRWPWPRRLAASGQRAPVKVVWSREDDMRAGYYRPLTVHRAEIGFDAQGKVLGWDHRIVSQSIVGGTPFEAFLIKDGVDGTTTEGMRAPYDVPMRLAVHHPNVNVPVLWWITDCP